MLEIQINAIKKLIADQDRSCWESTKLGEFLAKNGIVLSGREMYELTRRMTDGDIYEFIPAISHAMQDLAADDAEFVGLLCHVIDRVKMDMTGFQFFNSFLQIGESDPELAMRIAGKLLESKKPELAGGLMGAACRKLEGECKTAVKKWLSSGDPVNTAAAIRTIRIACRDSAMMDAQSIFAVLERESESDYGRLRLEVMGALMDFYDRDSRSKFLIERLARSDGGCRSEIVGRNLARCIPDAGTCLDLLEICTEYPDSRTDAHYALVDFAGAHPDRVLEILAKSTIKDGYDYEGFESVLREMGKNCAVHALGTILGWIKSGCSSRLAFHIPTMVADLVSKTDKKVMLGPVSDLIGVDSDPRQANCGLDIILKTVSSDFGKDDDSELVFGLLDMLKSRAENAGIDVEHVTKGEPKKILQCALLVFMIKNHPKPLDRTAILCNLNKFPNIRDLLKLDWFEKTLKRDNRTHPVLNLLGRDLPAVEGLPELADMIRAQARDDKIADLRLSRSRMSTLLYTHKLDRDIKSLIDCCPAAIKHLRQLRNEPQFYATKSEVDFVAPFLHRYRVKMEPTSNSKKLDAEIDIDGQTVHVEVVSPNMFKPLQLLRGTWGVPDRIKSAVHEEFNTQIKTFGSDGHPTIVAIDVGCSEIGYEFVDGYLLGTWDDGAAHLHIHPNAGGTGRELDSGMNMISAVVCYETRLCDDLSYGTDGEIIVNPRAQFPLKSSVKEAMEETLFTKFWKAEQPRE